MRTFDLAREDPAVPMQAHRDGELLDLKADLAAHGHPVDHAIVLEWCESLVVAADSESAWVWGPAELDPTRGRDRRTVVPAAQLKQLAAIASTNLPSRRIAIAHEIPLDGGVRELLPVLHEGPRRCSGEVARALVGPPPAHPGLQRALRTMDAVVGGVGAALTSTGRALSTPLLDPIIFAVTASGELRDGEPALWIPLIAWRW